MAKCFSKLVVFITLSVVVQTALANISVPFELINGLIVVEAEVNGEIGNYIIDSGSNGILLNENSSSSDVSYQTLSSTIEGSETKIETFRVGEFESRQLMGFSTDLSNIEVFLEKPIDGILGYTIFNPNSLLFDFENFQMIISERELNDADVLDFHHFPFYVLNDLPIVDLEIAGEIRSFILDTGASTHFIDRSLRSNFKKFFVPTGNAKNIVTAGGEDTEAVEYFIMDTNIGASKSLTAYEKDFSEISKLLEKEISGLISISKLCTNKVFFNLNSNTLFYN
ncbi:MAG: pepsin/retropepsin-like aspartic protease family protein [Bacteroidota bacterium]